MNNEQILQIFSYFIVAITLISFLPQIIKLIKTKSAKDLSIITLSLRMTFIFLWFIFYALQLFLLNNKAFLSNFIVQISAGALESIIFSLKVKDILKRRKEKKKNL